MENYICINGKKAPLTEEQLKQLGLKIEPTILWTIKEEQFDYTKYTCPNCGHYFRTMLTVNKDCMIKNHRYCGHCGVQNIFGGEDNRT